MNTNDMVFVFGSNLAGVHGAGAAKWARHNRGAIFGIGVGRCGQSYAIPTKDEYLQTLPLTTVNGHIVKFLEYTSALTATQFQVTQLGCGLAGYKPKDIAPLFFGAPRNCFFDTDWIPWLGYSHNYWGNQK
jgi:hypothetical protein